MRWTAEIIWKEGRRWGVSNEFGHIAHHRDALRRWQAERFATEREAIRCATQLNALEFPNIREV